MARKLRLEQEGGFYHVINRGNYRRGIFEDGPTKDAFVSTLFEACERAQWRLHAFCVMSNHYHLALETPLPNLSEGMRWLQSTFANRFNRYRKEVGSLFQGRFKSLAVQDTIRLSWLCHYIHLNPVRAGLCTIGTLSGYRWCSYGYLGRPKARRKFFELSTCLSGAGSLPDERAGWRCYGQYLDSLQTDDAAQKNMAFEQMSRGWVIGTREYQRDCLGDERDARGWRFNQGEVTSARVLASERMQEQFRNALERADGNRKAEPWKIAIAAALRRNGTATNQWIADALSMGGPGAVSRYVNELKQGLRPEAFRIYQTLIAKVTA